MLKEYTWHGRTWQFDEKEAPADAVEVAETKTEAPAVEDADEAPADAVEVAEVAPKNKARAPRKKD